MSYYILPRGFELCGWKGLPFALRYPNPLYSDFFDRESYRVVYALDGKHDIKEETLTEKQKKLILIHHLVCSTDNVIYGFLLFRIIYSHSSCDIYAFPWIGSHSSQIEAPVIKSLQQFFPTFIFCILEKRGK